MNNISQSSSDITTMKVNQDRLTHAINWLDSAVTDDEKDILGKELSEFLQEVADSIHYYGMAILTDK